MPILGALRSLAWLLALLLAARTATEMARNGIEPAQKTCYGEQGLPLQWALLDETSDHAFECASERDFAAIGCLSPARRLPQPRPLAPIGQARLSVQVHGRRVGRSLCVAEAWAAVRPPPGPPRRAPPAFECAATGGVARRASAPLACMSLDQCATVLRGTPCPSAMPCGGRRA